MTYAEIAARLRVSGEAARQLVRRRGWRRIVPNRPGATTVVIVPVDELAGTHGRDTRPPDIGDTQLPDDTAAFETALTAIEAAHASEVAALRAQADTSEQGRIAMQALADQALAQLAEAGDRADRLERDLASALSAADQARAQVQKAEEGAEALRRADDARKARGLVARLRAAWRGE